MSREFSLDVLERSGNNAMNPQDYSFKQFKDKHGRDPKLTELSSYQLEQHQVYLNFVELATILMDPATVVYIRLNHGARQGSIARVVNATSMITKRTSGYVYNGCQFQIASNLKVELEWDDKKTWKFDLDRSMDSRHLPKGAKRHDLLIDYVGPTVREFEKKERVILPPAENPDAYGRIIKVDDWVMDQRFRIGRVTRISDKGTMWIKFISQNLGQRHATKTYVEQFGRSSTEILILELPEGFETTALIMDNDVRDFEITPTFRFDYK